MARPKSKQGFRPIVVDGAKYRWRYDDGNRTADIEIHREDERIRGQRLCVFIAEPFPAQSIHSNVNMGQKSAIIPSLIVRIIQDALFKGWNPSAKGKDFSIRLPKI